METLGRKQPQAAAAVPAAVMWAPAMRRVEMRGGRQYIDAKEW